MKHFKLYTSILLWLFYGITINSQEDGSISDLNKWIDIEFNEGLEKEGIPGGVFVLVQGDSIIHINGYGLGNIETKTPISAYNSIFQIASITKTFVGISIMQLYEDKKLKLDNDINDYLTSLNIDYKYNAPVTIRQLLTHTAGFDQRNLYVSVKNDKDIIPLDEHLKKRMPKQIRRSGEVFTYSNYGYALLALIIEDITGLSFKEYVNRYVFEPLEMNTSSFDRNQKLKNDYVLSYSKNNGSFKPYELDNLLIHPAGGINSTAIDMSNYIKMFLNDGVYKNKQILDSSSIALQFNSIFKNYEETEEGWSLGFTAYQRSDGVKIFGHGGDWQEAHSQFMLFPEENMGLFISVNASKGSFMSTFLSKILKKMIPKKENKKSTELDFTASSNLSKRSLDLFSGTYRGTKYAYSTIDKLAVLLGLTPEIKITSDNGKLIIAESGEVLTPISEKTFYSDKNIYRSFKIDRSGGVTYFFPDGATSYHKLKWYETIKFQLYSVGIILFMLFIFLITNLIKKLSTSKIESILNKINMTSSILILTFILVLVTTLSTIDINELLYGVPLILKIILVLPLALIILILYTIWLFIKDWKILIIDKKYLIKQIVVAIAIVLFVPWLIYWNLLGFNF